ncbi:hypothetical protein DFH27DRAFT_610539 [Peziza echinospora]|nr:hypothetical protein DFH27DRAFT_610539 [Peziza echinospora]
MAFKERFGKLSLLRRISTSNFQNSSSNESSPMSSPSSKNSMNILIGKPYESSSFSGKQPSTLSPHMETIESDAAKSSTTNVNTDVSIEFTPIVRAEQEALRIYIHQITPQLDFLTKQVYLFTQYLNTVSTGLGILARHSREEVKQLLLLPQKPSTSGHPPGGTTRDWLNDLELRVPIYEPNAWEKAIKAEISAYNKTSIDIITRLNHRVSVIEMSVRGAEGKLSSMAIVSKRLRINSVGCKVGLEYQTEGDTSMLQGQTNQEYLFQKHVGAYVARLRGELDAVRNGLRILTEKYKIGNVVAGQEVLSCEKLANLEVPTSWPATFQSP